MYWLVAQRLKERDVRGAVKTLAWSVSERWHELRLGIRSDGEVQANVPGGIAGDCHDYEGSGYMLLRRVFRRIGPRSAAEQQVLLDAGCGLARAMIVAAMHPYASVRGFDVGTDLVEGARRNIARARPRLRCKDLRVEMGNGTTWRVDDDVTTVFLYSPFRGEVMDRFMSNVAESLRRRSRRLILAFANPRYFDGAQYAWLRETDRFSCFEPRMGATFGYRQVVAIFEAKI